MRLKPLYDRVIVRRDKAEDASKGGVLIPEVGKRKPQRGTVVAVGPGKILDNGGRAPMHTRAGDRVLFGQYAGSEFDPNEPDLLSMSETELFGIVEG